MVLLCCAPLEGRKDSSSSTADRSSDYFPLYLMTVPRYWLKGLSGAAMDAGIQDLVKFLTGNDAQGFTHI